MKKFIAAALSVLVGAFGYTIVDSTIENRVSSLESEIYALKQEVSRYHNATPTIDIESETTVKDLTVVDVTQINGYKYSDDGYYYIDDKECWVENSGYNEIYDNMAPLTAMFIDQVRVKFNYGGKDWMVQFWKGQYGWLLIGSEIGLYTADENTNSSSLNDINHYSCADKEDWLKMSMELYWAEGNNGNYQSVFETPYADSWWTTGFVKGQLTKYTWPRTELKMRSRITFKDADMANAFVAELQNAGFVATNGNGSEALTDDTYYQNGADVWILWHSIYQDCFK